MCLMCLKFPRTHRWPAGPCFIELEKLLLFGQMILNHKSIRYCLPPPPSVAANRDTILLPQFSTAPAPTSLHHHHDFTSYMVIGSGNTMHCIGDNSSDRRLARFVSHPWAMLCLLINCPTLASVASVTTCYFLASRRQSHTWSCYKPPSKNGF